MDRHAVHASVYGCISCRLGDIPAIMVIGWIFCRTSCSASRNNSPARTTTEVVPSPTSSSCTLEMSAKAGLLQDSLQLCCAAGKSTYCSSDNMAHTTDSNKNATRCRQMCVFSGKQKAHCPNMNLHSMSQTFQLICCS